MVSLLNHEDSIVIVKICLKSLKEIQSQINKTNLNDS